MAISPLADSRDIKFILFELLEVDSLNRYEKYADFDRDIYEEIIDLAERIAEEKVYPVNSEADKEHAVYDPSTKEVHIPSVLKPALDAYYEAGFAGTHIEPEYGGMGMPFTIFQSTLDYFTCAGVAFSMYPHLSLGAMNLVKNYGREEDRAIVCEKIISGEWGGTMCLTEPEAGSDVGALKSRAVQAQDDTYSVTGTKIFISTGDNDYYSNMIHPVLARVEGDPQGTKGISIFMTPKYRFDSQGNLTGPNDVVCSGIEHKMGITASPTCTLNFGDSNECTGSLMGDQCHGMKIMFNMMNETRLYVGLQAMSLSSSAYMHALAYSLERVQGTDPTGNTNDNVAIIKHQDVKRMLLSMKSRVEAMRTLVYYNTYLFDIVEEEKDETIKKEAQALIDIFIPICKAGNTDTSWQLTSDAIQVYGGYGFTKDYPVEQLARDSKILALYEGTNGIQSIDLTMRKLLMNRDLYNFAVYKKRITETIEKAQGRVNEKYVSLISRGLEKLDETVTHMIKRRDNRNMDQIFADATPLRELFVMMTYAWMHLWALTTARDRFSSICEQNSGKSIEELVSENSEAAYYNGRILSARYYIGSEFINFFGKAESILSSDTAVVESNEFTFVNTFAG